MLGIFGKPFSGNLHDILLVGFIEVGLVLSFALIALMILWKIYFFFSDKLGHAIEESTPKRSRFEFLFLPWWLVVKFYRLIKLPKPWAIVVTAAAVWAILAWIVIIICGITEYRFPSIKW